MPTPPTTTCVIITRERTKVRLLQNRPTPGAERRANGRRARSDFLLTSYARVKRTRVRYHFIIVYYSLALSAARTRSHLTIALSPLTQDTVTRTQHTAVGTTHFSVDVLTHVAIIWSRFIMIRAWAAGVGCPWGCQHRVCCKRAQASSSVSASAIILSIGSSSRALAR